RRRHARVFALDANQPPRLCARLHTWRVTAWRRRHAADRRLDRYRQRVASVVHRAWSGESRLDDRVAAVLPRLARRSSVDERGGAPRARIRFDTAGRAGEKNTVERDDQPDVACDGGRFLLRLGALGISDVAAVISLGSSRVQAESDGDQDDASAGGGGDWRGRGRERCGPE